MPDLATPNLPSRDFAATADFYAQLGFETGYRDDGWMILRRGEPGQRMILEFFPFPDLDPSTSSFSACFRMDMPAPLIKAIEASDVPVQNTGFPPFHPPRREASGLRIAYLVDPDGSLIRIIEND